MGDTNEMADADDVGKIEPDREGSSESIDSTLELEIEGYPQEVPQPQKRKGGRKPVCVRQSSLISYYLLTRSAWRFMQRQKSASNGIDKVY